MGKIQVRNIWYSLLKPFVDHHTLRSFNRYEVVGKNNIPKDGACIFGSNHCSTLVDALVLLATSPERKVFIARADIFKKPKTAKILRFLRILPIFRMRDGLSEVRDKNSFIIEEAVDVVHDKVPLYLFPEATHRTKHSLRQLSKGIFHIALEANRKFGNEKPVYIVPTGLEYGDYFRFRSTVLVSYGKPINVTEFVKEHPDDTEAVIINKMKTILTERIAELISFVPDDADYDAIWEYAKLKSKIKKYQTLKQYRDNNKKQIAKMVELREKEPEKAKALFEKVNEFKKQRVAKKISVKSVSEKLHVFRTIKKMLLLLVGLPYFIASAVLSCPLWMANAMIIKNLKDKAFRNTVTLCVEMVLHPLMMLVGIILLFCLTPVEVAVFAAVFYYLSYVFFVEYIEYARLWISDLRWILNKKLRKNFTYLDLF